MTNRTSRGRESASVESGARSLPREDAWAPQRSRHNVCVLIRDLPFQFFQKRLALCRQSLLQLFRAITIATRPRLCSVLVSAVAAGVRISHAKQLEILFPMRPLLRRGPNPK